MVFTNDLNVSVMVGVYIYSLCLWTKDVYYLKFYKLSVNTSSSKCNSTFVSTLECLSTVMLT